MAYDIIGSIAIIKPPFPDNLESYAKQILEQHKNIKSVYAQVSKVDHPYRVAEYRLLAGEKISETVHKEYGLRFMLDITKCYYSPRLENERMRIARQVKDGEEVLVMFSGVNPYPIYIAKFANPKIVYAVELNPWAFKYAVKNVKINKVNNVITILGDVRDVVPLLSVTSNQDGFIKPQEWYINDIIEAEIELNRIFLNYEFIDVFRNTKVEKISGNIVFYKISDKVVEIKDDVKKVIHLFEKKFDRIVMPLPKEADTFLDVAIPAAKDGAIIHLYQFMYENEIPNKAYEILRKYSKQLNFDYEILNVVKAGDVAPKQYRVCIDFKIYK